MDPLDVIENKANVFPQFQPIFNSDEYRIIGYEVLGRIQWNDEVLSLASFFLDSSVPAEYKWEIDKEIYRKAVNIRAEKQIDTKLFFNIDPFTLVQLDCLEELMEMFQQFVEEGLNSNQVILEFRINDFDGDLDDLSHMFLYMKASGYQVALDDIRTNGTNLDHFSKLEPNIIKVDLSDLKQAINHHTYRDVLDALAIFARKIGASLHFKGIQDFYQLYTAWNYGGRYLQGFYLSKPAEQFLDPDISKQLLEDRIHTFIDMEHRKLQKQIDFIEWMDERMIELDDAPHPQQGGDQLIKQLTEVYHQVSFRIYICDMYGYQKTSNWFKVNGDEWKKDEKVIGKNWSWRTYFLDQIMQMKQRKIGMLSDKYRDIETNDLIRTYSYPIDHHQYLFLDLDPEFLFENDWLL